MKKFILEAIVSIASLVGAVALIFFMYAHLSKRPEMIQLREGNPPFKLNQDIKPDVESHSIVRLETAPSNKKGQFFCSGTVISDDYVLTAAHCLTDKYGNLNNSTIVIKTNDGKLSVNAVAAAFNSRADYGLIRGNFKEFEKLRIETDPQTSLDIVGPVVAACGYPWGARLTCYQTGNGGQLYFEHIATQGLLFPGMSGGPVVDTGRGVVFAVNTAVAEGFIIISPIIGLFETLEIEVVQ